MRSKPLLAHSLDDFFSWQGVSWFIIAKHVRLQVQFWLNLRWAVSSRLRCGLPERGMARQEEARRCFGTCDELVEVLPAGDMKDELDAVLKPPLLYAAWAL